MSATRLVRSCFVLLAVAFAAAACTPAKVPDLNDQRACETGADCPSGQWCQDRVCEPLPCGGACASDEVCVEERCQRAELLDCSANPSVCPNGFSCTAAGVCRRECEFDSQCPTPGLKSCNPATGFCGECTFNSHCTDAARPFCDLDTATCVGCLDDASCRTGGAGTGRYCEQSTRTCEQGCVSTADCPSGRTCKLDGSSPVGRCIECEPSAELFDCADTTDRKRCDPDQYLCVQCLGDSDCDFPRQCNLNQKKCVECTTNDRCDVGEVCDLSTNTCVAGCVGGSGDHNCPQFEPQLPLCDPQRGARGTCVQCMKDADCGRGEVCDPTGMANPLGSGRLPACVPGCRSPSTNIPNDARCAPTASDPDASKPYCWSAPSPYGKCAECLEDSHCAAGKVCDSGTKSCRCKQLGDMCSSNDECGAASATQCGAARNYCAMRIDCSFYSRPDKYPTTAFCSIPSSGALGERGNCPTGYVTERVVDSVSGSLSKNCVPAQYKCQ